MRSTANQHLLYRGGVVAWVNSQIHLVSAAEDVVTLRDMVGHMRITLHDDNSLGIAFSDDDLYEFILHAQRRGLLIAEWDRQAFTSGRGCVPENPPVPPTDLTLACPQAGVVNASHSLPSLGDWDRCELWHNDGGTWTPVVTGTADTQMDYQVTDVTAGDQEYCVVVFSGAFASFPSETETVTVT